MHQYDDPTAAAVMPTPTAAGTPGFYRDGNAGAGIAPALVRAEQLNAIQMELLNILDEAGITPDKSDYTQVAAAIVAIATTVAGGAAGTTGDIKARALSTVPAGWLECDGAAVSRTTYAALFTAIGTTYGAGDGSTTFNLPDLRGEFIRGWDHGRGVDAARALGSAQADEFKSHTHSIASSANDGRQDASQPQLRTSGTGVSTGAAGGSETRPRNIAMMYVIKT